MTDHTLLGTLSSLHGLTMQLAESTPEDQFQHQFQPELGSMAHILGESVYRELYWLREVVQGDGDLSQRVENLFRPGALPLSQQCSSLPPKDHLLNWAAEIQEQHLLSLANPGMLPDHPLLEDDAILYFILQEHARSYERMLSVRLLGQLLQHNDGYQVASVLESRLPTPDFVDISQGAYRIGSRAEDPHAYDNELPPQIVELSPYRIAKQPVSNAEYLAFMEDGGYRDEELWGNGLAWLKAESTGAPLHWRRDSGGAWYGIGLNGPADLIADDPVQGICLHEARVFATWADRLGGETGGAVIPHEYQWEAATRTKAIPFSGRVWEWCSNGFSPYSEYRRPDSGHYATADFDGGNHSIRGACLHTQPILRRSAFRNRGMAHWNFTFTGIRLVVPPGTPFWEQ